MARLLPSLLTVPLILLSGCESGPPSEPLPEGDVILNMDRIGGPVYDLDSFGRRLTLTLEPATGIGTEERCGEVDPQNVVLVLRLPAGATFVPDGVAAYEASSGTVTWQLGTLDAQEYCFGRAAVEATLVIEPSVPEGAILEVTAAVSTSTPGDDPSDNERAASFQVGYLPVEVWVTGASASCYARPGDDKSSDLAVSCEGLDPGNPSATGSASASYTPGDALGEKLGDLTLGGNAFEIGMTAASSATSGHDCDISSCWILDMDTEALLELDFEVRNPNPYVVPLRTSIQLDATASCAPIEANAGPGIAFGFMYVGSLGGFDVQCTYDGINTAAAVLTVATDGGSTGVCELDLQVSGEYPESIQETLASGQCPGHRVATAGTHRFSIEMDEMRAEADSEIIYSSASTVERVDHGDASFHASATVTITLAAVSEVP